MNAGPWKKEVVARAVDMTGVPKNQVAAVMDAFVEINRERLLTSGSLYIPLIGTIRIVVKHPKPAYIPWKKKHIVTREKRKLEFTPTQEIGWRLAELQAKADAEREAAEREAAEREAAEKTP